MFRRAVVLMCCAALLLVAPLGTLAEGTYHMAGFDGDESRHVWESNGFFTRMEARTGVTFTFEEYTDYGKWQTAKQAMLAGGELPDVLFKAELTDREQIALAEQGKLIDLKPLLPEYAPNLWALLTAHPDWLSAITLPDGKIVALPAINETPTQNAMWINGTWLDALGLAAPTDLASLTDVLRAFKTRDPNGNGKADEVPLSFLGPWDLKFLTHAVGLVANDYNVYLDAAGAVRFMPEDERYLTLLMWLRDAYAEGLLDQSGFTTADPLRTVSDEKAPATYGLFFGPNPMNLLPYETGRQYRLLLPLTYEGKQVYRDLSGPLAGGTFAITSACADPAALLAWVDVLYTEEGAVEAMAGKAGADYQLTADGGWSYAGNVEENANYVMYDLSVYDTGNMPWLFPQAFYNRYQNADIARVNGELATLNACAVQAVPPAMLTAAEQTALDPVQAQLGRYVDESLARFVLGEWDIRSAADVAAYRAGLTENGSATLTALWQGIADRLANQAQ